jgi:hypothetical protein
MKNNNTKGGLTPNTVALPNNDIIARGNLQSRDVNAQPYIKLNVGQGNNFIVKNSNIVITSNNINKGLGQPTSSVGGGPVSIPIMNSSLA